MRRGCQLDNTAGARSKLEKDKDPMRGRDEQGMSKVAVVVFMNRTGKELRNYGRVFLASGGSSVEVNQAALLRWYSLLLLWGLSAGFNGLGLWLLYYDRRKRTQLCIII
jgi:hypothetical protein